MLRNSPIKVLFDIIKCKYSKAKTKVLKQASKISQLSCKLTFWHLENSKNSFHAFFTAFSFSLPVHIQKTKQQSKSHMIRPNNPLLP
jgi:hypothetical protein